MTQQNRKSDFVTPPRSEALRILAERGFIKDCTDLAVLDQRLVDGKVTAYAGFDATADSLHVGHLLPLMALRWLEKCGHEPIVLLGGGTSEVGDPSLRKDSRPLLEQHQIAANISGMSQSIEQLFDFDDNAVRLLNNAEWLKEFQFLDFLREFGPHFTVNRMLTFETVKNRLEAHLPLTVLEFCYMMLQAVDFIELSKRYDCSLQIGGSDQWGNIVNGVELGRRTDRSLIGLTVPLLTTASGAKMGKTAAGAVWLNPERLSPFGLWQFFRNVADADVTKLLKLFTERPMSEIARIDTLEGADLNDAKIMLASDVTRLIHGDDQSKAAERQGAALFSDGTIASEPTHVVPIELLAQGFGLLELMTQIEFSSSNSEARRLIQGGGVRLNGQVIEDEKRRILEGDLSAGDQLVLAIGRRRKALVAFR